MKFYELEHGGKCIAKIQNYEFTVMKFVKNTKSSYNIILRNGQIANCIDLRSGMFAFVEDEQEVIKVDIKLPF